MAQQGVHDNEGRAPAARKCTVLNCEVESRGTSLRSRRAILTLGGEDGTIDRVVFNARDGVRLVERLAFAFRADMRPLSIEYGSRAWFSRNSTLRAEARVEDDEEFLYDRTKRRVPDVVNYMDEEVAALRKLLARRGRTAARPETVVGRVRRAMLVLIDAMRFDT